MRLTIKAAAHSQIKDVDRNGTEFENLRYTFSGLHTASGEELRGSLAHTRNAKGAGFSGIILEGEYLATSGGFAGGWLRIKPEGCNATKKAVLQAINSLCSEDLTGLDII